MADRGSCGGPLLDATKDQTEEGENQLDSLLDGLDEIDSANE
jgi:hypothetical protein